MSYPHPHAMLEQLQYKISDVMLRSWPLRDFPLRIRPVMIFLTAAWLLFLGFLGFAPLPELAVNDKVLHFFGLGIATALLYFIIEVPEGPQRRIWYIRRAPLIATLFLGFFCGGVLSEVFQGLLPWKTFQFGDIVANLSGSSLALYLSHLVATKHRHRQHVAQLYQPIRPLATSSDSTYQDLAQQPNDLERGHADDVWDHADDEYGTEPNKVFDLGEDEDDSVDLPRQ